MSKLFDWMFRKKWSKILIEELNSLEAKLKYFAAIKTDERTLAYLADKLRGVVRYAEIVNRYDKCAKNVKLHNKQVAELDSSFDAIVNNHPIKTIVQNISSYTYEQVSGFNAVAGRVKQYKFVKGFKKAEIYKSYIKDIDAVCSNFSVIQKNHKLLNNYWKAIRELPDKYIDNETAGIVLASARKIISELTADGFHQLPKLDSAVIERHNEEFINRHLGDKIFDNIDGRSLDNDQRRAVLCESTSNLTIAGAGSGKTLTICGKVKYLLETGLAVADEILLMSYSKASAEDLDKRVSKVCEGLKVETFHALGLDILRTVNGKKKAIEEQFKAYITKYFDEVIPNNPAAANKIFEYFSFYLQADNLGKKQYSTQGEIFEDLKQSDYRTLKNRLGRLSPDEDRHETLKNEFVKSYEELVIANYLFVNGIRYEYEMAYEEETSTPEKRQYTPDFYLPDYKIYLEHYGINRKGRAPQYTDDAEKEYIEGIAWKRRTHSAYGTKCIETYSYEFKEGTIFENLKSRLEKNGVKFKPLNQTEINNALHKIYAGQEFASLFNLITTFIALYKSQYKDAGGFNKLKSQSLGSQYENERASRFLSICEGIYEFYIENLRGEDKIDFDDMILQAIDALDCTDGYRYKYIIVDEFQDISQSRTQFLKKLVAHGKAKLFAVGDDWQAIYRFAGCDLNVFLQFEQYFNDAVINYISSTHRNSSELQTIVEPFIKANPEQYPKTIKSDKHQKQPVRIIYHDSKKAAAFTEALQDIAKIDPRAEVLVLGRNKRDADCLICKDIQIVDYETIEHSDFPGLDITYKTVHSSKGLESDYVILISGEDSKNGFPNKMEDDILLNLVLGKNSSFEFAEERRLFYVALTRTKSIVYILSDKNKPSVFVKEIEHRCHVVNPELKQQKSDANLCPYCKSGQLIIRKSGLSGERFYGCSNFPYCSYAINDIKAVQRNNRCPQCDDFLVIRFGKYGKFISCHGYPHCTYKENTRSR